MNRQVPGLHEATPFPDGFFLVRVVHAQYRPQAEKPFLALNMVVTEPAALARRRLSTRLYCTTRALWKLNWFLRDFGYDTELLERDEIDAHALIALIGLRGVVKVLHSHVSGPSYLNLEGFAPAGRWEEFGMRRAG